jgi:hypothetical protein
MEIKRRGEQKAAIEGEEGNEGVVLGGKAGTGEKGESL